ncbi:nucleotidyltransferase domain-containing protein [Propionivibrio sp.]|uniref:nucleotidyltransferase domain-containing protein n=1 Tax=Propionivibrio sp. TaxID=2212460 RepID=UPI003BF362B0
MPSIDHTTEIAVRRFIGLVPVRFGVNSAILFGSRARGTHDQDSDADLAIRTIGDRLQLIDQAR